MRSFSSPTPIRRIRERLSIWGELALAALPTITVLVMLALVDALHEEQLLFASLASSAFLIYLDPEHGMNRAPALVVSQLLAAGFGWVAYAALGAGFLSAGAALVATILVMVSFDVVHPPAVGTAMSFALRAGKISNVGLFALALGITVVLVVLQRAATWVMIRARAASREQRPE
jgi:CBS-domain-containing membrane protein